MMNFIWWLIIGLIAGALARLIMPDRDPMGIIATILLGIVGSSHRRPGEFGHLAQQHRWIPARRSPAFDTRRNPGALDLADGEEPQYRLSRS